MRQAEKTVFISYRRKDIAWALAIFQALTGHGYDVFFDFQSITHGDFERAILENILARAHFIVLLTPSALDRCLDHSDWVRREIETALEARRNIVPVMLEGFDFGAAVAAGQLAGKLGALGQYNGVRVPADYFQEAMTRLREHLDVPLDAVLHPISPAAGESVREQQKVANEAPPVAQHELTALEWFRKGFVAVDLDEKLRCYDLAIDANRDFAAAYRNRALVRMEKGDFDGTIRDCTEAIRIVPTDADAYCDRGVARAGAGDHEGAIADLTDAIRLAPRHADAYNHRGIERAERGDPEGAVHDYSEVIRLQPEHALAYFNRALALAGAGDADAALDDFDRAVSLRPNQATFHDGRGLFRASHGDLEGAAQDHSEAIRLEPGNAASYFNRASARKELGALDEAARDYAEAIRLAPRFAAAYFNRALVWQMKADFAAAIADYREYLDQGAGRREGDQAIVEQTIRQLEHKLGR